MCSVIYCIRASSVEREATFCPPPWTFGLNCCSGPAPAIFLKPNVDNLVTVAVNNSELHVRQKVNLIAQSLFLQKQQT